jgi:hypothetical protein
MPGSGCCGPCNTLPSSATLCECHQECWSPSDTACTRATAVQALLSTVPFMAHTPQLILQKDQDVLRM